MRHFKARGKGAKGKGKGTHTHKNDTWRVVEVKVQIARGNQANACAFVLCMLEWLQPQCGKKKVSKTVYHAKNFQSLR